MKKNDANIMINALTNIDSIGVSNLQNIMNEIKIVRSRDLISVVKLREIIEQNVTDHRRKCANYTHPLINILLIFMLGVICGKDTVTEIYDYSKSVFYFLVVLFDQPVLLPKHLGGIDSKKITENEKKDFIKNMDSNAKMRFYIPSYNTLLRAIRHINPDELIRVRNLFIIYIKNNDKNENQYKNMRHLYISCQLGITTDVEILDKCLKSPKKDLDKIVENRNFIEYEIINTEKDLRFYKNDMEIETYNGYKFRGHSPYQPKKFYKNGQELHLCAIDGKSIKATKSLKNETQAKHIISLYECETGDVLSETEVPNKTNEITQDTIVLDKIVDLECYFISLDALGCQHHILEYIDGRGGLYLAKIKGNQKKLKDYAESVLDILDDNDHLFLEVDEQNKYRYENRAYYITDNVSGICCSWPHAKAIGKVEKTVIDKDNISFEIDYYIMNFFDKTLFAHSSREHWKIENGLHRSLDCSYREDSCRVRTGKGAYNLNILRKAGINILNKCLSFVKEKGLCIKRLASNFFQRPSLLAKSLDNVRTRTKFSINELLASHEPFYIE